MAFKQCTVDVNKDLMKELKRAEVRALGTLVDYTDAIGVTDYKVGKPEDKVKLKRIMQNEGMVYNTIYKWCEEKQKKKEGKADGDKEEKK